MNTHLDMLKTITEEFCLDRIRDFFLEHGDLPEDLEVKWNTFLTRDSATNKELLKPVEIDGKMFLKTNSEFYTQSLEKVERI